MNSRSDMKRNASRPAPSLDRHSLARVAELALQEAQEHAHLCEQLRAAILAGDQNAVNSLARLVVGLPTAEVMQ